MKKLRQSVKELYCRVLPVRKKLKLFLKILGIRKQKSLLKIKFPQDCQQEKILEKRFFPL